MKEKQPIFCVSNWGKKTPCFYRRLGNIAIYTLLPGLITAIMASPLSLDVKLWFNFILTLALLLLKVLTKFFAEEPKK